MNPILDDVFQTDEPTEYLLVQVSRGTRFVNFLIDYIVFIILMGLLGAVLGLTLENLDFLDDPILSRLFGGICFVLYYTTFEYFTKGKTLGKYITRSRVVTNEGEVPTFSAILGRSLARLVPLEVFSFFGSEPNGWHDRWSETLVVDERESVLPVV